MHFPLDPIAFMGSSDTASILSGNNYDVVMQEQPWNGSRMDAASSSGRDLRSSCTIQEYAIECHALPILHFKRATRYLFVIVSSLKVVTAKCFR